MYVRPFILGALSGSLTVSRVVSASASDAFEEAVPAEDVLTTSEEEAVGTVSPVSPAEPEVMFSEFSAVSETELLCAVPEDADIAAPEDAPHPDINTAADSRTGIHCFQNIFFFFTFSRSFPLSVPQQPLFSPAPMRCPLLFYTDLLPDPVHRK